MNSTARNRTSILATAGAAVLLAGWLLPGSGPMDARAEGVTAAQGADAPIAASPGLLHVQVVKADLRPGITADQELVLHLEWTAMVAEVFVERSHGVIRFWNSQGDSIEVDADVRGIQPGGTMQTSLSVDWNEQDAALRHLRREPDSMQAAFVADGMRTVLVGRPAGDAQETARVTSTDTGSATFRHSLP